MNDARGPAHAARLERGAWFGLSAVGIGVVGAALERGWPSADDPTAVARFIAEHRGAILGQSAAFLLGAAALLGFVSSFHVFLRRADTLAADVALVAGITWCTLGIVAQSLQIGVAMAGSAAVPVLWTMNAVFAITNLPLAVMLAATALAALTRRRAIPSWLGWLSAAAACAQVPLCAGAFVRTGALAVNGWLTSALYPAFIVWLVAIAVAMLRRSRRPTPRREARAPAATAG